MIKKEVSTFDNFGQQTLHAISEANLFNKWMYETISPFIKGNILELGCGIGNITDFILKDFSSITISDYNPDYIQYLKKKYSQKKEIKEVLSIDLQSPDFKNEQKQIKESFDAIILLNVIEHLQDDLAAIENCNYLLKKGGNLILLAPAYTQLFSPMDVNLGHYRRYTIKSLLKLLKQKNLEPINTTYFNFLGAIGWLFLNKLLRFNNINRNEMYLFNKLVPTARIIDKLICNQLGLSAIVIGNKK
jgi:2-polyprenyl-3-methyl-5-hydroxy-6-metoxy-1,4-benzoquinol methylase